MGDEQQRRVARVELLLQPLHRLGVEVVGGLVEHQQVGPGEQRAGDGHALLLAAGELVDGPLPERGVDAQAVEQLLGLEGRVPAAQPLDALGEVRQLGHQPFVVLAGLEALGERVVGVERLAQRDLGDGELGGGRGAGREDGLLRQPGDARAALELQGDGVGLLVAGQDLHQRRLAAAVDADQADALALLDDQLELVEERAGAEGERDVEGAEQRHRASYTRRGRERHARRRAAVWTGELLAGSAPRAICLVLARASHFLRACLAA